MSHAEDLSYMEMAFGLAENGVGRTSPNPCVGAVLVKNGAVVGAGWHRGPGRPHAEIMALRQAGSRARGAALYLTLEPCVHWGRTPPCLGPVLDAGLARVVISGTDPNPLVNRRGANALRRAGIPVSLGLLEEKNRRLNQAYFKHIRSGEPFVTLKAALTWDGRMATRAMSSRWISSPAARDYVHLLRAEHDALLVGVGTIARDNPRLTVRHPLWPRKKLLRVVLDTRLRFPSGARLLDTRDSGGILIFTGADIPAAKARALEKKGAEILRLPGRRDGIPLRPVLRELGRRQVASVLVEGGSAVGSSFLDGGLADRIFLSLSPKLFGGRGAPSFYEGRGAFTVRDALRARRARIFELGDEIFLEGYL
ncbi:MAG: bifunctional diaminohydroxyphosphoribosylaminopyrimidine deaminase/5-amino-6-(5-phosphoribosylamino)uracil reductase RibD [Candidatus Aminicenantes bacterium]|nr:bifunctional diaminohydroxyphosphoribosylaminopyrimidine deaminase/5-amino-6-(5-phosphoribosylamino)uracil reductase RibD [Candidatus Aminicenantes bacterium]